MILAWAIVATFLLVGALICAAYDEKPVALLLMLVAWPLFLVISAYVAAERRFLFGVRFDSKTSEPSEFLLRSPLKTRTLGPFFAQSYSWWRHLGSRWVDEPERHLESQVLIRHTRKVGFGSRKGRHVEVYKTRDVAKVWESS